VSSEPHPRIALVTGGTDGIGKEIARGLASQGLQVVIVGRDGAKGAGAEQNIRRTTNNPHVEFLQADLSLMREARRLADEITGRWTALHCLVHSAGIVRGRRVMTNEGIESNFATNYLARFALTGWLLPLLQAGARPDQAARILLVSGTAQAGRIYFEDVNLTTNFSTVRVVLQSCRANDLFTFEQARRLASSDLPLRIAINCLKLGPVKTNIRRGFPWWMKLLVPLLLNPLLGQTPSQAADAALRLLDAEFDGVTGALFSKMRSFKQLASNPGAADGADARRLWQLSERLVATALSGAALAAE
jgi:NAD(P)-dependent dehydrogenase (short-subunit alcohol dehydrogenase family)